MKVIAVGMKQLYRFSCPHCGSKLEAEADELTDIGSKTSEFHCPICCCMRLVPWRQLKKHIVYDEKGS